MRINMMHPVLREVVELLVVLVDSVVPLLVEELWKLARIVPTDRWWPRKAMQNSPHGTWWSAGSAMVYDAHEALAGPMSYWAAYRVF
jgi:hypothetical protein